MTPSFALHDVYRALDILIENKTDILKYLYKNVPCKLTRNYSILYFDGTNTYMETEIEEGLKARGKGKRNEIEPLVSLGLILDGSGIPVSYVTFKGSGSECKQLIPLEKILEKDFKHTDFVMITDSALSSKEIRCFNSICNKNYITVSPVRKMSEEKLKKYIFNDKEWKTNDKNYTTPEQLLAAYRSLEEEKEKDPSIEKTDIFESKMNDLMNVFLTKRTKALDDVKPKEYRTNVNEVEYIPEDYIVSFSLKYLYREELQRERILKKAQNMVTKDGVKENYKPSDPRKYINKVSYTKDGEVAENTLCGINEELVLKEKRLDGYYAVVTSLTEEDDENIIHWMKQRWMIEDTFLVMKQFFGFRPINHSKDNRIDAHFFSVFLTTLFYRYIQKICNDSDYNSLKNLSDEEILDILKGFSITETKSYYFPNFDNDQKKQDIQELFNVNLSNEIMKKTYVTKEFKKKISKK
jgi:transposase